MDSFQNQKMQLEKKVMFLLQGSRNAMFVSRSRNECDQLPIARTHGSELQKHNIQQVMV